MYVQRSARLRARPPVYLAPAVAPAASCLAFVATPSRFLQVFGNEFSDGAGRFVALTEEPRARGDRSRSSAATRSKEQLKPRLLHSHRHQRLDLSP
jgi:hypothetical protein